MRGDKLYAYQLEMDTDGYDFAYGAEAAVKSMIAALRQFCDLAEGVVNE